MVTNQHIYKGTKQLCIASSVYAVEFVSLLEDFLHNNATFGLQN